MKKIIFSWVLLIGCTPFLFGQTETNTQPTIIHQIGMNIGPLVKSLTNKGNFRNTISQSAFTYKRIENDLAFRAGLGFGYEREKSGGSNDKYEQYSGAIWVGLEKQKSLGGRWSCYTGGEIYLSISKLDIFGGGSNASTSSLIRLSPLFGIQFRITPRLFLQTEAKLNFYGIASDNTVFFVDGGPIFIDPFTVGNTKTIGVSIALPNILNLAMEF